MVGSALLFAFIALVWLIAVCRCTYHLARYFQSENYSRQQYFAWFRNQRGEVFFVLLNFLSCIAVIVLIQLVRAQPDWGYQLILGCGVIIVTLVLTVLNIIFQPSDGNIIEQFVPTQRTIRLVIASTLISIALPLLFAVIVSNLLKVSMSNGYNNPPIQTFDFLTGVTFFVAGPIAMALATIAIPLTNTVVDNFLRKGR